ncbi:hypothetical protein KAT92_05345 [Candidatus Babeliales bacterium]|nr:hypothetical protein [Candidatus Babeliales bacterium]
MLIHSHLYYDLYAPVISDDVWQKWANELITLQKKCSSPVYWYDDAFKDWNGDTGMHLPFTDWVKKKAKHIADIMEKANGK